MTPDLQYIIDLMKLYPELITSKIYTEERKRYRDFNHEPGALMARAKRRESEIEYLKRTNPRIPGTETGSLWASLEESWKHEATDNPTPKG